jgi:hypothetical protein
MRTLNARLTSLLAVATAAVAVTAAVPAIAAASDSSQAKQLVVTRQDLPAGWTAGPHDSTGDQETARALAGCAGVKLVKPKATVDGRDLTKGNLQITSKAYVYASKKVARAQFAGYRDADYAACAKQYFGRQPLGANGEPPTSVQVGELTLKAVGERRVGYILQAEIPDGAQPITLVSVQVAAVDGRAIFVGTFNAQDAQGFPQALGEKVLKKVDHRLDEADL